LILLAGSFHISHCKRLHVEDQLLVDELAQAVTFRGVDRSGTEYMCIGGYGIFDGPSDDESIDAIKSWGANMIRLPLNEDCWLAINGVPSLYAGTYYQSPIIDFVNRLSSKGFWVILDLHWTASGTTLASGQQPMPDYDHSIDFWKSVASTFKNYGNVIFDLFNEPYPDNGAWDTDAAWTCWKNGGYCNGFSFRAAGMQDLVNAVRSVGASNVVMLGGLAWSNSLTRWLDYRPTDSYNNTVASWHVYNFNYCNNQNCWDSTVSPVASKIPVITGEFGTSDCGSGFVTSVMNWMDSKGISYVAWTWDTWGCNTGPCVIEDYDGQPTQVYGQSVHDHYLNKTQVYFNQVISL